MPLSEPSKFYRDPNPEEVDLIDVINELQNKLLASGHSLDISLPQIVVIGCQSAGKSSVLESFVGKEFLPRGSRLVTRRPTVVQLIPSKEEYGVFLHTGDKKYFDFTAIRDEIVRVTDEECGPTGFSKKPISLTIYSPKVLKLTVVDLPGIIRVAVGDQEQQVIQIVRDMVLEYIKKDKCIILAVTPTGQDLGNSDALELAKIVDPNGERTIGVLTKLDMMEEGTDARDILDNTHMPLKRSWVGVINRNSKEMKEGKDMEYILKKERDFFLNNDLYSHMAYRMGTLYLQKLLQRTLRAHIKHCLPNVRKELTQKLLNFKKEIKALENIIGDGPNNNQLYMVRLLQQFSDEIHVNVMGYSETVPENTLTRGAVINIKLYTEVQRILQQVLIPDDSEIALYIVSISGMKNSISIPSLVMDAVCKRLIELFKDPIDSAVICIRDILVNAVKEQSSMFDPYPSLKHELLYQINIWIDQESENTQQRLKEHIDAETFYINTGHPDFDSTPCDPMAPTAGPMKVWKDMNTNDCKTAANDNSMAVPDAEVSPNIDTSEKKESDYDEINSYKTLLKNNAQMQKQVQYVAALVIKYLEIIQKQISDTAIKYIAYFLVKKVLDSIKFNLVTIVLDSSNMQASIIEDRDDEIRRKEELEMACENLAEALEAIKSF